MLFVHKEEIVKVASNLLGRLHCGINVKFRVLGESREDARQHRSLNFRCNIQFRANALFFRRYPREILDVFLKALGHAVEGVREQLDFVARVNIQLGIKTAAGNLLDPGSKVGKRLAELFGKHSAGDKHKHGDKQQHYDNCNKGVFD